MLKAVAAADVPKPGTKSYEVSVPAETSSRFPSMFPSFRNLTDHLIHKPIDILSPSWKTLDPFIKVTRMGQPFAADDMHRERMVRMPDIAPECPYAEAAVLSGALEIQPAVHRFGVPGV